MIQGVNCDFDEQGHAYWQDKCRIISVTQVLDSVGLISLDGIPQSVLDRAADRGSYVDSCLRLGPELDRSKVHPDAMGYITAYDSWVALTGFKVRAWGTPRVATVNGMKFGLTEDITGWMSGGPWLIDIKCTSSIYDSVPIQLAGYKLGLGKVAVTREGFANYDLTGSVKELPDPSKVRLADWNRAAVQLFPDGTFKQHTFTEQNDEYIFLAALSIVTWRNNRRAK